jgi:hypothetical protein
VREASVIVRTGEHGIQLITQPDHAHLARAFMEHATALTMHARREDILLAIGEHDNGWTEEDAQPTVDPGTGSVVDFVNASLMVRQRLWPRGVARLAHRPWSAALVAQHAITVYDRFRPEAAWTPFFQRMEAMRDEMVVASGSTLADLEGEYPFVRLADLISLTFCTGWAEEQRYADWIVRRAGSRVIVTPDPFGGVAIPIAVPMREIPAGSFRSDGELRDAFNAAPVTMLSGKAAGA